MLSCIHSTRLSALHMADTKYTGTFHKQTRAAYCRKPGMTYVVEGGSCVPFQNLADRLLAVVATKLSWWCARFRASLKILARQEEGTRWKQGRGTKSEAMKRQTDGTGLRFSNYAENRHTTGRRNLVGILV